MSFPAQVFRILIASPSDVEEEREIAVKTIQEWNDLNSSERQLVLLPLRWETHSAPEYGRRPQEVINRQVVDHCDLLVGIFWTRVGSPTGIADSGTLEEIERVANQGKPVMLYFSKVKQDPEHIDLVQLQKLRDFKQKTFPKGLVEAYASPIEFRDKLAKQIEMQLRTLLVEQGLGLKGGLNSKPVTDILFEFADPATGVKAGSKVTFESDLLEISDFDSIPDYQEPKLQDEYKSESTGLLSMAWLHPNKDYYREMVRHIVFSKYYRPVRFWLKNIGAVGARDVYVDVRIVSDGGEVILSSISKAKLSPPSKSGSGVIWTGGVEQREDEPEMQGNKWRTHLELRALQPQREVSLNPSFVIGAKANCVVTITASIYADTLPEPLVHQLEIDWKVNRTSVKADQLLSDLR
ncbi:MAG: hypothetical protein RI101_08170 [Nitrospira sp.]|jgi:hypothetical protein|nr:hypothetical protein [Nitrospira sp.]